MKKKKKTDTPRMEKNEPTNEHAAVQNSRNQQKIIRKIVKAKYIQDAHQVLESSISHCPAPLSKPVPTPHFDVTTRTLVSTRKVILELADLIALC